MSVGFTSLNDENSINLGVVSASNGKVNLNFAILVSSLGLSAINEDLSVSQLEFNELIVRNTS